MKVVKCLLPALTMLLTVPVFADETNLTIGSTEGNNNYGISQVKTLVFTENAMQVKLIDGTMSADFPYANLTKIYFSDDVSGTTTVDLGEIKVSMDAERKNLIISGDIEGDVNIYNLSGVKVINSVECNGTVYIGNLTDGIYVLEINNTAIKFKK